MFGRARKMFQVGLVRYATCRKTIKTSFSWKQFVARQATLLRTLRMNRKKQSKLFNVPPHIAWKMKNNRAIAAYQRRLERFRVSREEHVKKQLTLREVLQLQQQRQQQAGSM